MIKDDRIDEYQYLKQLKEYISNAPRQYIEGKKEPFIYPKQLEIHLPSDRQTPCNLSCKHCFSKLYKKELGRWEPVGLSLLHNLKGAIPMHVYGGSFCEPGNSSFLFPCLAITKLYNGNFGIHTSGVTLLSSEKDQRFLTNLYEISTDKKDYISISLDAGSGISWQNLKRANKSKFFDILQAIEIMANLKEKQQKDSHSIRLTYLVSDETSSQEEIEFIIALAKMYKINSLRFSIPYSPYLTQFNEIKKHKKIIQDPMAEKVENRIKHLLSKSKDEIPYIFWVHPFFTDINRFNFEECYYGYFQITLGADGYIYPCSAVAAPSAFHLRKGFITDDLNEFHRQCWEIQNNKIKCNPECFSKGLFGNRMALEINEYYNNNNFEVYCK